MTLGLFYLSPLARKLERHGKLRVVGLKEAIDVLRNGNVLVAANHPDGFTPFGMSAIFGRKYRSNPRYFLWNMPRQGLVPTWLHWYFRCIEIDRGSAKQKAEAFAKAVGILRAGGNIFVFPEGTRTYDPIGDAEFVVLNGRKMRRIKTGLPLMAAKSGASILPVWIDFPGIASKLGYRASLRHLDQKGVVLTVHFGSAYKVERPVSIASENLRLERKILLA